MTRSIPQNPALPTEELFSFIAEIVTESPDKSCFASTATLAKALRKRKADVSAAKWELIKSGRLELSLRANGSRRNRRHRLTLPTPSPPTAQPRTPTPQDAMSRVPDPSPFPQMGRRSESEQTPLMALDLWGDLPRLDQIDVYMRSGWNICPLVPYGKVPIMSREKWSRYSRDEKIDYFYNDPTLNVGLWINTLTVFDYDSDRQPENTLVAMRGDHSHNYFQPHPEIYNTSKEVADDIDTRASGGLIVLPPSTHQSGQPYEWATLRNPAPVPDKLVTMWRNRQTFGGPTGFRLNTLPPVIREGERDNYLWAFGRSLRASGATLQAISYHLHALNRERFKPQLSEREVERKIKHVWQAPNRPDWKL